MCQANVGLLVTCLLLLRAPSLSSLSSSPLAAGPETATEKRIVKKVLILGAGLSGITAANTLLENNITDFYVLEAKEYIGGRIHAVQFGGITIETGANWLHSLDDDDSSVLAKLTNETEMGGVWCNYSDIIIRSVVAYVFCKRQEIYSFVNLSSLSKINLSPLDK